LVQATSPRAGDNWPAFMETVTDLHGGSGWPAELERARLWSEPHLERIHKDAVTRRAGLLQLEQGPAPLCRRTRFIPNDLLNLFAKTAWPVIAAGSAGMQYTSQGVRVDVGARMRGMWR
jgi:hypothetical protein